MQEIYQGGEFSYGAGGYAIRKFLLSGIARILQSSDLSL
jgi:hypothetical protein